METGTSNRTIYCSMGNWKGQSVLVAHQEETECQGHILEVVHHYGKGGKHYCPTGFLMCPLCGGIANEPEPYECNKYGVK